MGGQLFQQIGQKVDFCHFLCFVVKNILCTKYNGRGIPDWSFPGFPQIFPFLFLFLLNVPVPSLSSHARQLILQQVAHIIHMICSSDGEMASGTPSPHTFPIRGGLCLTISGNANMLLFSRYNVYQVHQHCHPSSHAAAAAAKSIISIISCLRLRLHVYWWFYLIAAKCCQCVVPFLLSPFHHLTQPGWSTFSFQQDTGAGPVSLFLFVIQVSSYLVTQNDLLRPLSFLPPPVQSI